MDDSSSWRAVADRLRVEFAALPPGTRLPSQRALVRRFGASATTVARANAALVAEGLVEARSGAGSYRAAPRPMRADVDTSWQEAALRLPPSAGPEPTVLREYDAVALASALTTHDADVVDLNGGYLHPELQPADAIRRAFARAVRHREAWQRPDAAGLPELRDVLAREVGGGLSRHDVLVTGGGQAALAMTMRAVGQPGDPVLVEAPTYPGTIAAARSAGLRVVALPVDDAGIVTEHLDRALAQTGARLVVVQPGFQNPTGASQDVERRRELVALAARHGAFVVEDDFARYLRHADADEPLPPLVADDPGGRVIHLRSLTKSTSPNLRVAALCAKGPVMARLRAAHAVDAFFVPAVLQRGALELLADPSWPRALTALGAALAERRDAAVTAAGRFLPPGSLPFVARGGFHLWLRLPEGSDDREVAARALRAGVAVTPGSSYQAGAAVSPHLRVSYVAAPAAADVAVGIERLGGVLQALE